MRATEAERAGWLVWAAALAVVFCCTGPVWSQETRAPLMIADFENGSAKPFDKGTVVAENAVHGTRALKLDAGAVAAVPADGLPADWSAYDVFRMEVFNPTDGPLRMTIQVRDPMEGRGYWAWHDRYTGLVPGRNTVEFAVADMWRGEVLRRDIPGMVDVKHVTRLSLNCNGPWYLDYVRLEAFPAAKVQVPGLKAFDVGPAGSPGFPGFTQLTEKDTYSKEKGFGWLRTNFGRLEDRIHPDNLFRDWISGLNSELAVDLPNGRYRVHMQLEDPGYWELMQNYPSRQVLAEGKTVIDETMNAAQFMDRYFRNQDVEDFPDQDPFEKYVENRHPWHTFDVDVADGQLNLVLRSPSQYGATLSALVVYPAVGAAQGAEFIDYVKAQRKFDWSQRWKPVSKPPQAPVFAGRMAADAQRDGFVLFTVSPYQDASYAKVPADDERLEALAATAARGEYEPCSFGMKSGKPLGKVEVTVSPLTGANGGAFPADQVSVRVGRYRFKRYQGNQSGLYSVEERELRLFNQTPADELHADNVMTRRFWITVHVPEDARPGDYTGSVTVKTEKGGSRTIPLKLTVLPFVLPEPEHLFTLYGLTALPPVYFPEMRADHEKRVQTVYRDLRAHGINYIDHLSVSVAWQNNQAVVTNAAEVDQEIALQKRLGFKSGPVAAPGGCTLAELAGQGNIRGLPKRDFIQAWHKTLTDFYAARGWPHPYFCYGDEPGVPETLNALTAANVAVHEVSPDIWMGIAYHVQSPESYELMKTLDVHHFKAFLKPEDFQEAKKHAKFLLNCNVGRTRPAYGFSEWRATTEKGTDGCITFAYTGSHVDIYYGLDAREDDYSMAPQRKDGTLATTVGWEQIREGIDDYRYALALKQLAEKPGTAAGTVQTAKALLTEAMDLGQGGGGRNVNLTERMNDWRVRAQKVLSGQ